MTIKTAQTNQNDDAKRRTFAPIRRDLLERLTRECESQAGTPWHQPTLVATSSTRRAGAR
ncbi:MAG: hypothetical protein AAFP85_16455 [Pseudomonadota bacterium]